MGLGVQRPESGLGQGHADREAPGHQGGWRGRPGCGWVVREGEHRPGFAQLSPATWPSAWVSLCEWEYGSEQMKAGELKRE